MVEIAGYMKKDTKEILADMNKGKMGRTTDAPFQVARTAIELRIVNQLCDTILKTGEMLSGASTAIKECTEGSVKTLTNSIDEFRKSSDDASKTMKRWTKILSVATVVLASATVVLAFATIILALK